MKNGVTTEGWGIMRGGEEKKYMLQETFEKETETVNPSEDRQC